jgi:signal transduction histidine kinase
MPLELAELGGSWPVAASLAAAVTARGLATGRRRTALNEALHELRRPLHALALSSRVGAGGAGLDSTLRMAVAALEQLDREINGEDAGAAPRARLSARPLVAEAVARWRARAAAGGGAIGLRWEAGEAALHGDRRALERALDNLLANAIEHGGREVAVGAVRVGGVLRVSISDSGRRGSPPARERLGRRVLAGLSGRRRRGHGLRIVRRVAAGHDGEFSLRISATGTVATLELPLAGDDG